VKYQSFFVTEGLHCTCIFRTCVFQPCRFVLAFSVGLLAFSSTCVFSAPSYATGKGWHRESRLLQSHSSMCHDLWGNSEVDDFHINWKLASWMRYTASHWSPLGCQSEVYALPSSLSALQPHSWDQWPLTSQPVSNRRPVRSRCVADSTHVLNISAFVRSLMHRPNKAYAADNQPGKFKKIYHVCFQVNFGEFVKHVICAAGQAYKFTSVLSK